MNYAKRSFRHSAMVAIVLCILSVCLQAAKPNASALDGVIKSGDFAGYLTDANAWLEKKTPAKPTEAALVVLLKDSEYRTVLDQRQFIAKTGADKLGVFAKASPDNREFLGWLMKSAPVLATNLSNSHTPKTATLSFAAQGTST